MTSPLKSPTKSSKTPKKVFQSVQLDEYDSPLKQGLLSANSKNSNNGEFPDLAQHTPTRADSIYSVSNLGASSDSEQEQLLDNPNYSSSKRWLILFSLCTLGFVNSTSMVTFSTNIRAAEVYYDQSQSAIIWLANIVLLAYVLGGIPAMFTWNWSFRYSLLIPCFLNMMGAWLRVWGEQNYYVTFLGQSFLGATQLWMLPSTVIIPDKWFSSEERVLATTIIYCCFIFGSSFGFLSGAYMINGMPAQIPHFLFIMAILFTIPFVISVVLVSDPVPFDDHDDEEDESNLAPNQVPIQKKLNMKDSLKAIFTNAKTCLNINALATYQGINWTLFASLGTVLLDFSSTQMGWLGSGMTIAGIFGGLSSSFALSSQLKKGKTPKYDFFLKTFATVAFAILILLTTVLGVWGDEINHAYILVLTTSIGLGFNAFIPISAQSMLETVYPVNEIVGYTVFNQTASLLAIFGNILAQFGLWLICLIVLPLYLYLIFGYNTKLRRLEMEKEMSSRRSSRVSSKMNSTQNLERQNSDFKLNPQFISGPL